MELRNRGSPAGMMREREVEKERERERGYLRNLDHRRNTAIAGMLHKAEWEKYSGFSCPPVACLCLLLAESN